MEEAKPTFYKLKPAQKLESSWKVEVEGKTYEMIEFEPTPNKRYLVSIDIVGLSPNDAFSHMNRVKEQLKGFFPNDSVVFVPSRNDHPLAMIYEMELQTP